MSSTSNTEFEVRFLEIDKEILLKKLKALGAEDKGEVMLEEVIIYDKDLKMRDEQRFLRIRKSGEKTILSYKEHRAQAIDGAMEIEFGIDDFKKAEMLFEKIGFVSYRHQQKLRHTLVLEGVTFDIDTWPKVPPYVELEGDSEEAIKKVAKRVGFDWKKAVFENASEVLESRYNINLRYLKWLTFDRME